MAHFSPISKSFEFLHRISKVIAVIPAVFMTTAGIGCLLSGIIVVQLIQDRGLSLAIIGVASFIGATLLSLYLPKVLYLRKEQVETELSNLRETIHELEEARSEISRLKSMRMNVEAFKAISKLALLEVDLTIKDYCRKLIWKEAESLIGNPRDHWYSALLEIPVKAHLGVDLSVLRIQEMDRKVIVYNLQPAHMHEPGKAMWHFDEIRVEEKKDGKLLKIKSDPEDSRSKVHSRVHEAEVRDRIKSGIYIKVYEESVLNHARMVVRLLLTPLGKEIEFSQENGSEGKELLTYLNQVD